MKRIILLSAILLLAVYSNAQIVNIPDTNFKAALIAHNPVIDTNGDGEIQVSEAVAFTDTIDVYNKNISDLTGIEEFVNIIDLECRYNQLTSLDVSSNTTLNILDCSSNQITDLDLSNNTALIELQCNSNQLTSLDISANTVLSVLYFNSNQLTSIDVSANTALTSLGCFNNQLTSLDVSANTSLHSLYCPGNQLTNLDVSSNTSLTYLSCFGNQLTNLDVSSNISLTYLSCYTNQLTSLDVSTNTYLIDLLCYSNQLTNLDVSANTNLKDLRCNSNQITSLDVSTHTDLFYLSCSGNEITSLDVNASPALTHLYCYSNQITDLDVSNNTALTKLNCYSNQLTSLDVTTNTELTYLSCAINQITNLDVSTNTALTYLNCSGNQITNLDINTNTVLTELYCGENQLTSLDLNANTVLTELRCNENQITSLDISTNTVLTDLLCYDNQLTSLNVSADTALTELYCYGNQLTSLDISTNTALTRLVCYTNQLTTLNIRNGNNNNINTFNTLSNPNLTCIQVDDAIYSTNNWTCIDAWTSFGENCLYGIANPNIIYGSVLKDDNCIIDASPQGIKNIIVRTESFNFYGITDSTGAYVISTDTGAFQVKQITQNPLINPLCPMPNYHTVVFDSLGLDTTDINFFNEVVECPILTVDLNSDRRRRCFTNNTYVEYCNTGFADASGVEVTVQLPDYVIFVSADYPYTIDANDNYIFDIGNLAQGDCGTIHIIDSVACIADITGLTQCTEAWITPPNDCLDSLDTASYNAWDKSSVMLTGECINDTLVSFVITNIGDFGDGDMEAPQEYRIFSDNALVYTSTFQLNGGESITITYQANGQTIRLEADQHPMHPGNSHPQETIEACGGVAGVFSTGFVNNMPMDDEDIDIEIDCMEIQDSYDPNEKTVSPQGVSYQNYLAAGTILDYKIDFQNTGSDTAYTVIVVDTLSEYLNPSTIQWGVSSHPYTVDVSGMGTPVLRFTFNNINLPDSTTNEFASHGFVKFKVATYDSLENGIQVNNTANIYFDYNTAITTNTAQFTISDTVLTGAYINIEEVNSIVELNVYPNPFNNQFTVSVPSEINTKNTKFYVYDVVGKQVELSIIKQANSFVVSTARIKPGIYFVELKDNGKLVGNAKIVKE